MFWEIGMSSFDSYMNKKIMLLPRKSLTQTKEVLKERERLENTIIVLRPELDKGLTLMDTIRTT